MNYISEEIMIKPISAIKVHLKMESLLKEESINRWDDQIARTIMWQRYAIACMFSHIFVEVKERIKNIMKPNMIYTDGLTP